MMRLALALALPMGLVSLASAQETPQSAAAPTGPWMVFFDWGKPELRGDERSVLEQVAAAYRGRSGARLQLTGHTDRSGSGVVNRAAGLRRSEAVRVELEKLGISRSAISIASFGEDKPLVPTEDGVREVQNRRVEIAFEE